MLERGKAGCQQLSNGFDMLPRHAETGASLPIEQQIAVDVSEREAEFYGREYERIPNEELGGSLVSPQWGCTTSL